MSLFVGISQTLGLVVTIYIVVIILDSALDTAQVPRELSRTILSLVPKLTAIVSLIWMMVDSRRIGLSRYEGLICRSPLILLILGATLWLLVFPAYLSKRWAIKHNVAKLKPEFSEE
ncbi:MAG: hypothetical protein K2W95_29750 [Candidatus Obscuribacterales bacterium]|nr:hypothetical protein [Candidatus Obscuribacterales bacterium]